MATISMGVSKVTGGGFTNSPTGQIIDTTTIVSGGTHYAGVDSATATLVADGASPTSAHVSSLNAAWTLLKADLATLVGTTVVGGGSSADVTLTINTTNVGTNSDLHGALRRLELAAAGRGDLTPYSTGYQAQGVHFDGSAYLVNSALASSDNGTASFFLFANSALLQNMVMWIVDPANFYLSNCSVNSGGDNVGPLFYTTTDEANFIGSICAAPPNTWFPVLCSVDVRRATPTLTTYIGDTPLGQPPITGGSFNTGSVVLFNGLPLWIGWDNFPGDSYVGDMANLWIAPGVSLLDGSGDIPVATRRKFFDGNGKPISLGSDGSVPTGTAPAVFLSADVGNAASFVTNRGTGGSFALTGTLSLSSTNP